MADLTEPVPANVVRIPQWDDVIQIAPRATVSARTRRAWNDYMRENELTDVPVSQLRQRLEPIYAQGGDVAGITERELDTLLTGREKYQVARGSAIPGWRQQMVKVLTTLDNIEDQVSTIEWVTRPITRLWAPTKWLSRVTRRTTDVIDDLGNILAGPSIAKFRAKDRAARSNRRTARAASGKAGKLQLVASWLNANKGHLIEAGQATSTWAGVGIQLGSIFGAIEETQDRLILSAWEGSKAVVALTAKQFAPAGGELEEILDAQVNDSIDKVRETGVPVLEQLWGYAKQSVRSYSYFGELAAGAFAAATMQTENDTYTRPQHALALYMATATHPLLGQVLANITDARVIARILELDAPAPRVRDSYSRDLLLEAGATLTAQGYPSGMWQAPRRGLRQAIEADIDRALEATRTWLPDTEAELGDRLVHALTEAAAGATAYTLTGRDDGLEEIPDPATRAELLMLHLEAPPPPGTPRHVLEAWLADQVAAIAASPATYDWRTWRDVTARHWPIPHLAAPAAMNGERVA